MTSRPEQVHAFVAALPFEPALLTPAQIDAAYWQVPSDRLAQLELARQRFGSEAPISIARLNGGGASSARLVFSAAGGNSEMHGARVGAFLDRARLESLALSRVRSVLTRSPCCRDRGGPVAHM